MSNEQVEKIAEIIKTIMDNKEMAKQIATMVSPVISEGADIVMDTLGPNIENIITRVALSGVRVRKKVFNEYIKNGFRQGDAIAFMLHDASNMNDSFDSCAKSLKAIAKTAQSKAAQ